MFLVWPRLARPCSGRPCIVLSFYHSFPVLSFLRPPPPLLSRSFPSFCSLFHVSDPPLYVPIGRCPCVCVSIFCPPVKLITSHAAEVTVCPLWQTRQCYPSSTLAAEATTHAVTAKSIFRFAGVVCSFLFPRSFPSFRGAVFQTGLVSFRSFPICPVFSFPI